jgi:hypothetical protein
VTTPAAQAATLAAVVVNYNYGRFLAQAIDSLLIQTVPFDEIIVVDDGSTDDSATVLDAYAASIKAIKLVNGGQLRACLAGLAATSTDYVYFLDADDHARPELVATVLPHLGERPVKVQFQLEGVSAEVAGLESVFPTFPPAYDAERMRADNRAMGFYICPPTSGNVYRRDALQSLPVEKLDPRDFIDGPSTLVLPYLGEIVSVSTPLAFYRLHGANHSQWSEPTPELLRGEIDWFRRRWQQACMILAERAPAPPDRPTYVLEREHMIAALEGGWGAVGPAVRLLRSLGTTNLAGRQKVLLAGWAVLSAVPVPPLQRALVRGRRSPLNRSTTVRRVLRVLLRGGRR